MWVKAYAIGDKPVAVDSESSRTSVFVRKDFVRSVDEEGLVHWEYSESKVDKGDWASYTEIINNNSTVDNNQAVVDYNIMMGKLDDPSEEE